MVVTISFLDGRKFVSNPITVKLEKAIARFGQEATISGMEIAAANLNADAPADAIGQYKSAMDKLHAMREERDKLITQAFAGQFTLDEYEEQVDTDEAGRVIRALQGSGPEIIEKNG